MEGLLPTPVASFSENTPENHLRKKPGRQQVTDLKILVENGLLASGGRLLKTPTAQLAANGGSQDPVKRRAGGHGPTLADQVETELLPTPTVGYSASTPEEWRACKSAACGGYAFSKATDLQVFLAEFASGGAVVDWGVYSRAVLRWQQVLGRMVPPPTELSPKGKAVLAPAFVEWMMGLPEGWVTDAGLSRSAQLKILGNGVVPQQAGLALLLMLRDDPE